MNQCEDLPNYLLVKWDNPKCRKCNSKYITYTGMDGIEVYAGEVCGFIKVPANYYYCRCCNNVGIWNNGNDDCYPTGK